MSGRSVDGIARDCSSGSRPRARPRRTPALAIGADGAQQHPRVVLVTNNCSEPNFICPPFEAALRRTGVSGKIISPDDARGSPSQPFRCWPRRATTSSSSTSSGATHSRRWLRDSRRRASPSSTTRSRPFEAGPRTCRRSCFARTRRRISRAGSRHEMETAPAGPRTSSESSAGSAFQPSRTSSSVSRPGALRASPHARVLVQYSGDFTDPSKCEAIARSQIARGAGSGLQRRGRVRTGHAASRQRAGVWGIGVDTDQSGLGPHILTSVVKRYDVVMLTLLEQVRDGRIPGGVTTAFTLRRPRRHARAASAPRCPPRCAPSSTVSTRRSSRASCTFRERHRPSLGGCAWTATHTRPPRHGDVLGRATHRNRRQHRPRRRIEPRTACGCLHDATQTEPKPRAIPLAPVPAFAVLARHP